MTADAVRRVGLALPRDLRATGPRSLEAQGRPDRLRRVLGATRGRWGSASPGPNATGWWPPTRRRSSCRAKGDLRYQWVCARLPGLDDDEMRELVTDAWRMCVPAMLHELPELPAPAAAAWGLVDRQEWGEVRRCCTPTLHFDDGAIKLAGAQVLRHLADHPTPRPPTRGRGARRPAVPVGFGGPTRTNLS